ncbi:MAG: 2Fe-2S iron-sulfur cluster-binding protein [Pyrinomonadaceae bacterium]
MTTNKFENFLKQFTESDWLKTIGEIVSQIHEVDRNATQIWFRFHPLALLRFLETAEDKEKAIQKLAIQGDFDLKDQVDLSHKFLYGHRFWKTVKEEVEKRADSFNGQNADLKAEIEQIANTVSEKTKADKSLTLGISAVGLMTLNQVGFDAFKSAKGETEKPNGLMTKSPDKIVAERAKDDSQGIFGFLKTIDKNFTISWEDKQSKGKFALTNQAELATASALDQTQNWKDRDERCWEGVIPVECRSASCGTCWIGILAGEEKLSEVQRLERKQMKVFGYNQPDEAKPFMRLACQAKAFGNVSIVIPSWNGVFGKKTARNDSRSSHQI